jgi:hypothetical protein
MLNAYEVAINESREATKVYQIAVAAYRAMTLSDHSFAVAQNEYKKANAKFDVAFAIAQDEPEVEPQAAASTQMEIF